MQNMFNRYVISIACAGDYCLTPKVLFNGLISLDDNDDLASRVTVAVVTNRLGDFLKRVAAIDDRLNIPVFDERF